MKNLIYTVIIGAFLLIMAMACNKTETAHENANPNLNAGMSFNTPLSETLLFMEENTGTMVVFSLSSNATIHTEFFLPNTLEATAFNKHADAYIFANAWKDSDISWKWKEQATFTSEEAYNKWVYHQVEILGRTVKGTIIKKNGKTYYYGEAY